VTGPTGPIGLGYGGTRSTTTFGISALVTKTFTVDNVGAYVVGAQVRIVRESAPTFYMEGQITGITGNDISVYIHRVSGGGVFSDWLFSVVGVVGGNAPEVFTMSRSGTLTAVAGTARLYLSGSYTLLDYRVSVGTAPTGASLIVDGTTLFTTQGNRPTIAASGFLGTTTAPDVSTFVSGDYITIDVDQVGSTIAGADLTVVLRMTRTS
jgi:hypothetical protein